MKVDFGDVVIAGPQTQFIQVGRTVVAIHLIIVHFTDADNRCFLVPRGFSEGLFQRVPRWGKLDSSDGDIDHV